MPPTPSAKLLFSTLQRAGLFLISILPTIVSSLKPTRKCGTHDQKLPSLLNPALLGPLKRPRGPQRPALDSHGRMPANPGMVPSAEARQPWIGEPESHARTHRLQYYSVRSHRTLRQLPPNGFFRDIYPRAYHHSVSGAACAVTHWAITSYRIAPSSVEQLFHWGRQAHPSLSRRRRLVEV